MGKPEKKKPLGSVAGRIILKQNFKKWDGKHGMDWIHLAQERDRWRERDRWMVLVNVVMNLRVP